LAPVRRSEVTNAEQFPFAPDNLAVARRIEARFKRKAIRTGQKIVDPKQSPLLGSVKDLAV
jgi:hypothetical protein